MNHTQPVFFITGGSGFLGSRIAVELLKGGATVILAVRGRDGKSPRQRVDKLMEWYGIRPGHRLLVMPARIDHPGLDLDPTDRQTCREIRPVVIHCAADTSFARHHRGRARQVNLQGLEHVFSTLRNTRHFVHMSTAYTAGIRKGTCLEEPHHPAGFFNHYEESKQRAEEWIIRMCRRERIPLTLLRPSIVYGDSVTGRSLRFNALYYPVRSLLKLRDSLQRNIREGNGRRARELGVRTDRKGNLVMPLRVTDTGGGVDLIPVDHLARAATAIVREGQTGIFHIVSRQRQSFSRLTEFVAQYTGIRGISISPAADLGSPTPLEQFISQLMDPYQPYFCDRRVFDDRRTAPVLQRTGLTCPELDYATFTRCMDYGVSVNWGAEIFR